MKNKRNSMAFLLSLSLLALAGCTGNKETPPTASSVKTISDSSISSSSEEFPVSVNENITTSSNYYEEPAETADTGDAEGYIPEDLPEGALIAGETGEELVFTENSASAYCVTIEKAEFTDRRSVVPGDEADKVLLITYTYRSLNGEGRLVDDMSFRLFTDETAAESYYVADQISGDLSTDTPVTAEVAFSVPADAKEFSLFVIDNAAENNETYQIRIQL